MEAFQGIAVEETGVKTSPSSHGRETIPVSRQGNILVPTKWGTSDPLPDWVPEMANEDVEECEDARVITKDRPKADTVLSFVQPAGVCVEYVELSPRQQLEVLTGEGWVLEYRPKGLHVFLLKDENGFTFVDMQGARESMALPRKIFSQDAKVGFLLECMIVSEPTPGPKRKQRCVVYLLDCIWVDGIARFEMEQPFHGWITDLPLLERMRFASAVVEKLSQFGATVRCPVTRYTNRIAFYRAMTECGAPGVMARRLDAEYHAQGCLVNVRRGVQDDRVACSTLDAFTVGYDEGLLVFAVMLLSEAGSEAVQHTVAHVQGIAADVLEKMVVVERCGKESLRVDYHGQVAEIEYACIKATTLHLEHARVKRWLPERSPGSCMVLEAEMMQSAL